MTHFRPCGLVRGPKFRECEGCLLLVLWVCLCDCMCNLIWKWLQRSQFEALFISEAEWPCWHPLEGICRELFCRNSWGCPEPLTSSEPSPVPVPLTGATAIQSVASPCISSEDQNGLFVPWQGSRDGHLFSPGWLQPLLWYFKFLSEGRPPSKPHLKMKF